MVGLIRTRDLLLHGPLIVRLFGMRTYVRCVGCALSGGAPTTFLGAVFGRASGPPGVPSSVRPD
jgi:hypothetical protein